MQGRPPGSAAGARAARSRGAKPSGLTRPWDPGHVGHGDARCTSPGPGGLYGPGNADGRARDGGRPPEPKGRPPRSCDFYREGCFVAGGVGVLTQNPSSAAEAPPHRESGAAAVCAGAVRTRCRRPLGGPPECSGFLGPRAPEIARLLDSPLASVPRTVRKSSGVPCGSQLPRRHPETGPIARGHLSSLHGAPGTANGGAGVR